MMIFYFLLHGRLRVEGPVWRFPAMQLGCMGIVRDTKNKRCKNI